MNKTITNIADFKTELSNVRTIENLHMFRIKHAEFIKDNLNEDGECIVDIICENVNLDMINVRVTFNE